jgi:dTDP-4-amino-4,6-dideoxygalactose transaminase
VSQRKLNVPSPTLGIREAAGALLRPLALEFAERGCAELAGAPHAVLFASARGALAAAAACVAEGREVTLPAYTCIAVANGMRSAGVPYGFVDVAEDGTVPVERWEGAQVALVQDTYGFPAAVPEGVVAIRDCAHRADLLRADGVAVAVTSFEHSKWLSAGRGGLAVTRDAALAERMRAWRDRTPRPGDAARLRHGLSTLLLLLLGRLLFAGRLPRAQQALAIAADVLAPSAIAGQSIDELGGQGVGPELLGAPNGTVCRLVVSQLRRSGEVGAHRAGIVALYDSAAGIEREPLPLVRYPLRVDDVGAFERALAAAGYDAEGRWFDAPLHPGASDPAAFGYRWGSAPTAEALAEHVVNLPTHTLLSADDARALITAALGAGARPVRRV